MGGAGQIFLEKMSLAVNLPNSVGTFARARLAPGGEVGYHIHDKNSEAYYILSSVGEYTENGVTTEVVAGDVTYTPLREGHGIKNVGDDYLEFIGFILNS